jgi:hypothetical protein
MSARRPQAFGLLIDPDQLLPTEHYPFGLDPEPELAGVPEAARRVVALARALASSPAWAEMEEAILVVRTEPPQGIAFLGHFSDDEAARVKWVPAQLRGQLPHFLHVSWTQAEAYVEMLAASLVDRFGHREVREMQFVGIPRGGLIVLGMLAYALDLDRDRLALREGNTSPVVVVDDCAISGLRFGEFLRALPPVDTVVFAHLYSHPALREAIEAREPRVRAALAAADLRDLAPEIHGEDLQAWRSRWSARSGEHVYWVGQPEHVAYPWSEPDLGFWDTSAGVVRTGWRLVPPEACLKNRYRAGADVPRLQIQVPAGGAMDLAPGTFHGELDGRVLVAELASGQVVSLDGVAADFWHEFVRAGEPEAALARLEARYEATRAQLRSDTEAFLRELLARGLVTATPGLERARQPHRGQGA